MNKLVEQYNNTYHHSIKKNPINADYSALTEKIETNLKPPKFKIDDRVRITQYKNIFSNDFHNYEIKDLDGEKTGSFYEKRLSLSKL